MHLISEEKILNDNVKWEFDKIDVEQESYWMQSKANYGIEEYSLEDVSDLGNRIAEIAGICPETAKCLAVEAFRGYYGNGGQKKEQENRASALSDYVYML